MIDGTDHALLERFRRGDAAAFRALVVRYQRPVYNAAFGVLRNADDARDVAQTVFMRVAERSGDYDPSHKFFSWIPTRTPSPGVPLATGNSNLGGGRQQQPRRRWQPQPWLGRHEVART